MSQYRLTAPALRDLQDIAIYYTREASAEVAERIEAKLFNAFDELAGTSALGHRRLDVRRRDLFFYVAEPHLIAFRRDERQTVTIIRVLHGKRNVARILR